MLTLTEFNDVLSEVNQLIFDHVWDKFPGMFKIKQDFIQNGKHYIQIESESLGSIIFQIKSDGNDFALNLKLSYENAESYDQKNEELFNKYVKIFKEA